MKKLFVTTPALFLFLSLLAQAPNTFHYQAVVRTSSGELITNTTVAVQISILQGNENGFPVYMESFLPQTNDFGLISLDIGTGTYVGGDFEGINWADGPYFIKTEIDPSGGSNYEDLGSSPLSSVPYALHAASSDTTRYAREALYADTSRYAFFSAYSDTSAFADTAGYVIVAEYSDSAIYSDTAGYTLAAIYADTAIYTKWARHADSAGYSEWALYSDTANLAGQALYSDTAAYAKTAGNVFDGDYNSLSNVPDWTDTIAAHLDSAIILDGAAESGNLVTFDGMNWVAKDVYVASAGNGQELSIIQPYLAVNYCIALVGIYPSRNWEPFIGTIGIFGFNFAPRGWAQCSGQLLPISQHTALFSLLGTYYGGDGRTTFALPDLRGRVPVNQGQGPGLSPYSIGQAGGAEQVPVTIQNLPSHTHTVIFE